MYGYANGDPINFSDPFGLKACDKDLSEEDLEKCKKEEEEARQKAEDEAKAAAALHARCMAAQRAVFAAAAGDASVALGAGAIKKSFSALSTATRYAGRSANASGFVAGVQATGVTGAGGAAGVGVGVAANGLSGDSWYHWVPGLNVASRVIDQAIACSDRY